ncbi:hypothetical protein BBOV_III005270 [Babesia bovis T2Bo]|uniref:Uncharacterized protein n=1 Tax=Babesia bovis TaxID=5865 RepID=A7ANF6_BABBO|nr:hypothetical protein BBOV_III005270 [Babesia bovis T2Bo]EDO08090.1 hypothetical protein BBOV_III005270 [Babesia bovis T2Bo]|eukprot:XP_001611658.1 hypothetical protein [Babesia bovis T2Bo]
MQLFTTMEFGDSSQQMQCCYACHGTGYQSSSSSDVFSVDSGLSCETRCVSFSHEDLNGSLKGMVGSVYKDGSRFNVSSKVCESPKLNKCSTTLSELDFQTNPFSQSFSMNGVSNGTIVHEKQPAHFRHFKHSSMGGLSQQRCSGLYSSVFQRFAVPRAYDLDHGFYSYEFVSNVNTAVDDDHFDLNEVEFDFTTLTDLSVESDTESDPTSVSIVDMICGIPDTPDDHNEELARSLVIQVPMDLAPEPIAAPVYRQVRSRPAAKKRTSGKRAKRTRANATRPVPPRRVPVTTQEVLPVNLTVYDEDLDSIEWHPGFNRQLGAKGRSALLDLIRRVYRQDPVRYRSILQSRNPPTSISTLPFFNIPMLWELTHQFGVFKQALLIHKNQVTSGVREKCRTRSRSEQQDDTAVTSEVNSSASSRSVKPVAEKTVVVPQDKAPEVDNQATSVVVPDVEMKVQAPVERTEEAVSSRRDQHVHVEGAAKESSKRQITSSGRSIKPARRFNDYLVEVGRNPKRFAGGVNMPIVNEGRPVECPVDDVSSFVPSSARLTEDELMVDALEESDSLVWSVEHHTPRTPREKDTDALPEHGNSNSSSRDTPKRYISV